MTTSTATNPYSPATQFAQWLAWEKENAGGAPAATPKPQAPATTPTAPGVKPSAGLPGTAPTPPPYVPTTRSGSNTNYAQQNANEKSAVQLAGGGLKSLPANAAMVNASGARAIYNGVIYTKDPTTSVWTTTGYTPSKADTASALQMKAQAGTQQQNTGLKNAITTSSLPAEQRAGTQAIANSAGMMGTVPKEQGITVPGFEASNKPGAGYSQDGRHTIYGSNETNTLQSSNYNGPQIQFGPGTRFPGQVGNSINFGGGASGQSGKGTGGSGGYDTSLDPQMRFGNVAVSVPDTYVKGAGNINDSNRAYEVPFNIGQGGASTMSIGGSNVNINGYDPATGRNTGVGTGFALNAPISSNIGSATARSLSSDPAIQAAQTLQLIAATNQLGGGPAAVGMLTEANRAQYSGNTPGSTALYTGNGINPQGTWFAGAAPGPQDTLQTLGDQKDEESAGFGPDGGTRAFARGGNVITLPRNARASRPLGVRRFAEGGSVYTDPNAYKPPTITPGSTSTGPYGDPMSSGTWTPSTTVDNGPAPTPTPTPTPTAAPPEGEQFNPLDRTILDPYVAEQRKQAAMDRLRDSTSYQWQIAGRAAPKAIEVPLGYEGGGEPLRQGEYYSRTKALNDRINGITGLMEDYTALGPLGNETELNANIARTQQEVEPYKQAQGYAVSLAGLGETGNPEEIQARQTALQQQYEPVKDLIAARQKLISIGTPPSQGDIASLAAQVAMLSETAGMNVSYPEKGPEGLTARQQNEYFEQIELARRTEEQVALARGALGMAKQQLSEMQGRYAAYTDAFNAANNVAASLGITSPDQIDAIMGQYVTQSDTLKQQYASALKASELRNQMNALTGGRDPNEAIATGNTRLAGYNLGLGNIRKSQEIGNRLRALRAPATGFKKGGTVVALGKPKRAKKSMVTPEEIVGIGKQSGKPYFRVGEPRTPGGPPAPEKLTITPLPLGKRKKRAA